jgi:Family of unknown function (DUF5985)
MNDILVGAIVMGFVVAGLFFLRFWRSTRDRFFLCFAASFWLEGLNRLVLGLTRQEYERVAAYYLIRVVAYALVAIAIWDKNRQQSRRS